MVTKSTSLKMKTSLDETPVPDQQQQREVPAPNILYAMRCQSKHGKKWKQAIQSELQSLAGHEVVAGNVGKESTPSNYVVGTRWTYAVKPDRRSKARIVVQQFQENLIQNKGCVFICIQEGKPTNASGHRK